MKKYLCEACGYIYDPEVGDPDNGVEAGYHPQRFVYLVHQSLFSSFIQKLLCNSRYFNQWRFPLMGNTSDHLPYFRLF